MREIKFKTWHPETSRMSDRSYSWEMIMRFGVKEFVPLQYTGVKDKNNKEIYDGDILHIESKQYPEITPYVKKIEWDDIKCGWNITPISYFQTEIIGNIFENPELIK